MLQRCLLHATMGVGSRLLVVVGCGASGAFAAIAAARAGCRVLLLEGTSRPLAKVLASGGGRCNVMHDSAQTLPHFLASYPRGCVRACAANLTARVCVLAVLAPSVAVSPPRPPLPPLSHMPTHSFKELHGPLAAGFTPTDTRDWFEDEGVRLRTEPE